MGEAVDYHSEIAKVRDMVQSEEARRKLVNRLTQKDMLARQRDIALFLSEDRISAYPSEDGFVSDENEPLARFIVKAFHRSGQPLPMTSASIAQMVLTSYDAELGCDVAQLPVHACTVARVLAHVVTMGVEMPETVAASIARRVALGRLNGVLR